MEKSGTMKVINALQTHVAHVAELADALDSGSFLQILTQLDKFRLCFSSLSKAPESTLTEFAIICL
jgi:hypothetical protein